MGNSITDSLLYDYKPYKHSFVIGKFLPLHNGHLALIKAATRIAEETTVIVCVDTECNWFEKQRASWWESDYIKQLGVNVVTYEYNKNVAPNSSEPRVEYAFVWGDIINDIQYDYFDKPVSFDVMVSSEEYGENVARYMGIDHVMYDQSRTGVPISGTAIREDIEKNWMQMPDFVRATLAKAVYVVGTESTGKTTLCKALGDLFPHSTVMSEYGREAVPHVFNPNTDFDKLWDIEKEFRTRMLQWKRNPLSHLLICDTDLFTTCSYAWLCGNDLYDISGQYGLTHYLTDPLVNDHIHLVCSSKNVPLVQDGTRMDAINRARLEQLLFELLDTNHYKEHVVLRGDDFQDRTEIAYFKVVNLLLKGKTW